jgi:hypothetical protein
MADVPLLRAAIRQEGEFINAYLAPLHSMDGAQLLASIRTAACRIDPQAFDDFKHMVSACVQRQVAAATGSAPRMEERTAPEHERAGHG